MSDEQVPGAPPSTDKVEAAPERSVELPLGMFIKGGTTSSSYDAMLAAQKADADRRRAFQDSQFRATKQDPLAARMHSMKLGGQTASAGVVLALKHPKDNLILDWIICEVSDEGDDMLLIIRCPDCHRRNPGNEPDITIRASHRKWWLDPRPPKWMRDLGSDRVWLNPEDGSTVVVAGSVYSEDWMRCPGLGCTWHFKIDDSIVYSK